MWYNKKGPKGERIVGGKNGEESADPQDTRNSNSALCLISSHPQLFEAIELPKDPFHISPPILFPCPKITNGIRAEDYNGQVDSV